MVASTRQRMCFIGVSTGSSAIGAIFPRWCEALDLSADLLGVDLPLAAAPDAYRDVVRRFRDDPSIAGALVTTHKVALHAAAADLLDEVTAIATRLGEISCLYRRGDRLIGDALDPLTSRLALDAFIPHDHWRRTEGEALILGAGGASLAIVAALHAALPPRAIRVTDVAEERLAALAACFPDVHGHLVRDAAANDSLLGSLPPGSLVINATGMGKDRPGSPLTESAVFPDEGLVWELNYRGALDFMHAARRQQVDRRLIVEDGWTYFLHGWTRHIATVFEWDVPSAGPAFDRLDRIARDVTGRA